MDDPSKQPPPEIKVILTPNLAAALVNLANDLAHAFDRSVEQRDRDRYIVGLTKIAKFLMEIGVCGNTLFAVDELNALASALSDLDHGTVADFLMPELAQNRPLDTTNKWMQRMAQVIAVEMLVATGMKVKEAVTSVERKTKHAGSLEQWRRTLLKKNAPRVVQHTFDANINGHRADAKKRSPEELDRRISEILQFPWPVD